MRKLHFAVMVATAGACAVALAGGAAASPGGPKASILGQVYINDNTAPVNTVAGFNRMSDGTLAPIPGSPFVVGGTGGGSPNASQGSLELSGDGRYLLAVDAGSNQISVLRIKPDGSLQIAQGSPVDSGGVNPVSIAVSGGLVYVANQGPGVNPGDTNYTGFTLNPGGHLTPIPGSTYALPNELQARRRALQRRRHEARRHRNRGLGDRQLHRRQGRAPDQGVRLAVLRPDGLLDTPGIRPARERVQPDRSRPALRLGCAHRRGWGRDARPRLELQRRGRRIPEPDQPLAGRRTPGRRPAGSRSATTAFISSSSTRARRRSRRTRSEATGALSYLQSTTAGQIGAGAEDARLSPDGSTLWVVESGTNAVTGFSVSGGTLTPLTSAPGPSGATPSGIVVT